MSRRLPEPRNIINENDKERYADGQETQNYLDDLVRVLQKEVFDAGNQQLDDAINVSSTEVSNGQVLGFVSAENKWVPTTIDTSVGEITNVTLSAPVIEGQVLVFNSVTQMWENDFIGTVSLDDGAVTTDKIAASAVTNDKLAADAVDTVNIVDGAVTPAKIAANLGKVLQVVYEVKLDTFNDANSGWLPITGLSATMIPTSTTSDVFVYASLTGSANVGVDNSLYLRLVRDGTPIATATSAGTNLISMTTSLIPPNANAMACATILFVDSPAVATSVTYSIEGRASNGGEVYINRPENNTDSTALGRAISTLILAELDGS
jgi:hypothetical protein